MKIQKIKLNIDVLNLKLQNWNAGIVSAYFVAYFIWLVSLGKGASPVINQFQIYYLFFLGAPVLALLAILTGISIEKSIENFCTKPIQLFFGMFFYAVPICIMVYGLVGIKRTLYHLEYLNILDIAGFNFSIARFIAGCVLTCLLLSAIFFLYFSNSRIKDILNKSRIEKTFVILAPLFFFILILRPDIGHDSLSYDPYIGPASAVALGANPFTEVFSQYGLNYLILAGALKVMPWSIFSVSLVITLIDSIYLLLVLIACIRIAHNRIFGALIGIFLILFFIGAFLYNPSYTPSALGMRYLPSLILLISLFTIKNGKSFNFYTVSSIAISSIWSLEALIFSATVFFYYIFLDQIKKNKIFSIEAMKEIFSVSLCIFTPHLILVIISYLIYGSLPRYAVYIELITTTQKASSGWIVTADPLIRTWLIPGLAYALTFCYSIYYCWIRRGQKNSGTRVIKILGCTSILGIVQLSYYAGRAVTPALLFISFPLLIIFTYFIEKICISIKEGKLLKLKIEPSGYQFQINFVLIFAVLVVSGGILLDRLYRPISPLRSNSILLRECLKFEGGNPGCFYGMLKGIKAKLRYPSGFILPGGEEGTFQREDLWQVIPNGMTGTNIGAYLLVKKWLPNEGKAYIFITNSASVFFSLKKQNALGLSCPMVEDRSPTLRGEALSKISNAKEGELIFVGDLSRQPIEEEIIAYLNQHWKLEKIDELYGVIAYRLKRLDT